MLLTADLLMTTIIFSILNVSAIVLANLCVSYIMTSQNEEAEELMRKIEKEEEQLAYEDPDRKVFHLCIVNLVIGKYYFSLVIMVVIISLL
jgi:tetratricopeptide repeat protein 30